MKGLITLALVALAFTACSKMTGIRGSGNLKTETRTASGFKQVKCSNAITLDVSFKPDYSLTVEADDNLLQYITTEVDGDTLVIKNSESINTSNKIKITLAMPELAALDISGASTAAVAGIKADKLDLDASGASHIKIDGEARTLDAHASGASGIDAENLKTENADADASGASHITVNATGDLKAEASGASSVTYVGEPKSLKQHSSGASSVKKK